MLRFDIDALKVNRKTGEFFFSCLFTDLIGMTTGDIKDDVKEALDTVAFKCGCAVEKIEYIDIQMHLLDGGATIKVRGMMYED